MATESTEAMAVSADQAEWYCDGDAVPTDDETRNRLILWGTFKPSQGQQCKPGFL